MAVGTIAAITVASAATATLTAHAAASGCTVSYTVPSQWSGGFTADVRVTNLGDPLTGWILTWAFSGGQTVSQGWNATITQSGTQVRAENVSYNGTLPANGTVQFGFNGTSNGTTNPAPTAFALNGVACTGSVTPTTGTPTTGTPPTATPTTGTPTSPPTSTPTGTPTLTPTSTPIGPRPTFTNPIKRNGPDPWLQYHNGYYHLATTTWNSTITMRRSRTLGGLATAAETVVFNLAGRTSGCCTMWAPEFHLLNGPNGQRWYLYYTAADTGGLHRLHVLESAGTDPMGPYTFKADLSNDWALDASVLQHNGNLYLMGTYIPPNSPQSLFIVQLANPWTTTGSRVTLTTPTLAWERQTAAVAEGPEPLYHNGRTFVIYSASACWGPDYKLGMLTLTGGNPMSPSSWTKNPNPVFQRNDANSVFAPGHNGFFKSPDGTEDWIVYHANDSVGGGCDMNRSTRAQKFTWNADGTPNFGVPTRLGTQLTVPAGE